jgi:phospholipid/cholesterol/gamma-HCH transport system substrate-binding protein
VTDIALNDENDVDVIFEIHDTYYDRVKPNSVLEHTSNPLGLGGGLHFHPGANRKDPLPENSFIPSLDFESGRDLVARGLVAIPEGRDAVNTILAKVEDVLDNLNETLVPIQSLINTVDGSLSGTSEGPLADMIVDIDLLIAELSSLIQDTKGSIAGILANVEGITGNLEQTTAGLTDPTGIVTKVLDPKGSIAKILDDDYILFNQIEEILRGLNDTVSELEEFTAFINKSQPQISGILEKGREALDEGKDVLEGLKNNPLLRGGIPEVKEQATTFESYRDEEF